MSRVVILTERGTSRVLGGQRGMTFVVTRAHNGPGGEVVHVRDFRYPGRTVWALGPGDYEDLSHES